MNKNKIFQPLFALSALLLALILIVATVLPMGMAWLSDKRARVPNLNSGVQGSYFESGDGTKEIVTDANGNIVSGVSAGTAVITASVTNSRTQQTYADTITVTVTA